MQIQKKIEVLVKDSRDEVINEGDVCIFNMKGNDHIGKFAGIEKGLLVFKNLTDNDTYSIATKSVGYITLVHGEFVYGTNRK